MGLKNNQKQLDYSSAYEALKTLQNCRTSASSMALYFYLKSVGYNTEEDIQPSPMLLAKELKISTRGVHKCLKQLRELNMIPKNSRRNNIVYSIKDSGIYQIKNTQNGIVYIGMSKSIPHRIKSHKNHLNRGSHSNCLLQADWLDYGADCFEFTTILHIENHTLLKENEERIISEMRKKDITLYNLTNFIDNKEKE